MAEGNNGGHLHRRIAGCEAEALHHVAEPFAGVLVKLKNEIKRRSDKNLGDVIAGQRLAKGRVFEDALFDHVVLPDYNRADLFAMRRNPEERAPIAHWHGPLPFDAAGWQNNLDGHEAGK